MNRYTSYHPSLFPVAWSLDSMYLIPKNLMSWAEQEAQWPVGVKAGPEMRRLHTWFNGSEGPFSGKPLASSVENTRKMMVRGLEVRTWAQSES